MYNSRRLNDKLLSSMEKYKDQQPCGVQAAAVKVPFEKSGDFDISFLTNGIPN